MANFGKIRITSGLLRSIDDYIAEHGLYRREFAQKVQVDPATISNWFSGRTKTLRSDVAKRVIELVDYDPAVELEKEASEYAPEDSLEDVKVTLPGKVLAMIYDKLPPDEKARVDAYVRAIEAKSRR